MSAWSVYDCNLKCRTDRSKQTEKSDYRDTRVHQNIRKAKLPGGRNYKFDFISSSSKIKGMIRKTTSSGCTNYWEVLFRKYKQGIISAARRQKKKAVVQGTYCHAHRWRLWEIRAAIFMTILAAHRRMPLCVYGEIGTYQKKPEPRSDALHPGLRK